MFSNLGAKPSEASTSLGATPSTQPQAGGNAFKPLGTTPPANQSGFTLGGSAATGDKTASTTAPGKLKFSFPYLIETQCVAVGGGLFGNIGAAANKGGTSSKLLTCFTSQINNISQQPLHQLSPWVASRQGRRQPLQRPLQRRRTGLHHVSMFGLWVLSPSDLLVAKHCSWVWEVPLRVSQSLGRLWEDRVQVGRRHQPVVYDSNNFTAGITSGTQPLPATTTSAISVAPPSMLKGKSIEEIINRWSTDLEIHVRDFNKFASEVAVWDRSLIENGNNVSLHHWMCLDVGLTRPYFAARGVVWTRSGCRTRTK